jgi:hypothetical protein
MMKFTLQLKWGHCNPALIDKHYIWVSFIIYTGKLLKGNNSANYKISTLKLADFLCLVASLAILCMYLYKIW